MKWYRWIFAVSLLLASLGLLAWWLTTPLGPHLQLRGAALPPDYTSYWAYIRMFGIGALIEGGVIVALLGAILWKLLTGGTGGKTQPTSKG